MFEIDLMFVPWSATFIVGICTILLIYRYSTRNHDYWKKRGIPYVKPYPFIGSLLDVFRKPLQDVEQKRYHELGPLYGHFEASKPLLSVADPELIRKILVKDFQFFTNRRMFNTGDKVVDSMLTLVRGEDWKRIRTIVSPTFSTGKIKRMFSIFKDCSQTLAQNFKMAANEGKFIDAKRLYGAFTMDIIASCAFSTKVDSHNDPDNKFVKTAREAFNRSINWRFILFFVAPKLMKLLRIVGFNPGVMNFFKEVTHQIIEERRSTGQVRNDFLQLLMDTAKEVEQEQDSEKAEKDNEEDIATNYGKDDAEHQILKIVTSKKLSMDELVAQCVIFFIAGYETTATALSFATYLLALNPDIQDELRAEVDDAVKQNGGELTYEAVQSMKYLDNVISETLRIYPPGVRTERMADADYKLGDTGLTIPKGMLITIPIYALHRDPKYYPNPEKFDPDRFSVGERVKRNPYVYLPFGVGPRNCVAMRFALTEVKVCLAHVISNFVIKRCPQTKVPPDFHNGQGLLQPKEILLEMELRKESPLR